MSQRLKTLCSGLTWPLAWRKQLFFSVLRALLIENKPGAQWHCWCMDAGCIFHDWKCVVQSIRHSTVAKFCFICTALMTVLQRPMLCVLCLSFIQATLNEGCPLIMSILQRNELWKDLSKHVPTVHTKDCINDTLHFHKTFLTICCCSACTSLSFLQLKFANRKAFQC